MLNILHEHVLNQPHATHQHEVRTHNLREESHAMDDLGAISMHLAHVQPSEQLVRQVSAVSW